MSSLAHLNLSTGACTFLVALALPSVSHLRPFSCKEIKAHAQHYCVFWVRQSALAALSRITDVKTSIWILASATYESKRHLQARSWCWCRARGPGSPCPHLPAFLHQKTFPAADTLLSQFCPSHCCRLQVCWGFPV